MFLASPSCLCRLYEKEIKKRAPELDAAEERSGLRVEKWEQQGLSVIITQATDEEHLQEEEHLTELCIQMSFLKGVSQPWAWASPMCAISRGNPVTHAYGSVTL